MMSCNRYRASDFVCRRHRLPALDEQQRKKRPEDVLDAPWFRFELQEIQRIKYDAQALFMWHQADRVIMLKDAINSLINLHRQLKHRLYPDQLDEYTYNSLILKETNARNGIISRWYVNWYTFTSDIFFHYVDGWEQEWNTIVNQDRNR